MHQLNVSSDFTLGVLRLGRIILERLLQEHRSNTFFFEHSKHFQFIAQWLELLELMSIDREIPSSITEISMEVVGVGSTNYSNKY